MGGRGSRAGGARTEGELVPCAEGEATWAPGGRRGPPFSGEVRPRPRVEGLGAGAGEARRPPGSPSEGAWPGAPGRGGSLIVFSAPGRSPRGRCTGGRVAGTQERPQVNALCPRSTSRGPLARIRFCRPAGQGRHVDKLDPDAAAQRDPVDAVGAAAPAPLGLPGRLGHVAPRSVLLLPCSIWGPETLGDLSVHKQGPGAGAPAPRGAGPPSAPAGAQQSLG